MKLQQVIFELSKPYNEKNLSAELKLISLLSEKIAWMLKRLYLRRSKEAIN
jgi:hypothetical protein